MLLPFLRYIRPPRWYKHVAYDIAQGLAHLHAAGIVHGGEFFLLVLSIEIDRVADLHLGNIGFVVPALAQQDPFELMDELSPGPITLVLPADVMEQTSSLPAYLVEPSGTEHYMKLVGLEPARAKIIDFGSGEPHATKRISYSMYPSTHAYNTAALRRRLLRNSDLPSRTSIRQVR